MILPSPNLIETLAEIRSAWGFWYFAERWRQCRYPELTLAGDLLLFANGDDEHYIRLRDRREN